MRFASTIAALSSAEWLRVDDALGNTLNHQITNLSTGTLYYFEVRATNEVGVSGPSNRVSATTSSVVSYLGYGTGSGADPYRVDTDDFTTARNIARELNANNRSAVAYSIGGVSVSNVAAVVRFSAPANVSGSISLASSAGVRDIDMRLYRGETQVATSSGVQSPETLTWSAPSADEYVLLLVSSGSQAFDSGTTLQMTVGVSGASSSDGASGAAGDAGAIKGEAVLPVPRDVRVERFGVTGARMRWRSPGYAAQEPRGYLVEYQSAVDGPWRAMGETPGLEWTEQAGIEGDVAWRVSALYEGAASDPVQTSVLDLFGGASAQAAGDPVDFIVLTNDASARFTWDVALGDDAKFWAFGLVEGEGLAFDATNSTYYTTQTLDLARNRSGHLSVDFEAYAPSVAVSGSDGAGGAAALQAPPSYAPAFAGLGMEPQTWAADTEIAPVTAPAADVPEGDIAYAAEGLPRGVVLSRGLLSGAPAVGPSASGVARIAATADNGAQDFAYFAWQVGGALAKSGGDGTRAQPHTFKKGWGARDIRDLLRDGATNADDLTDGIPTWFRVSVPAGETWEFRVESEDDFDLLHDGAVHQTGERAEVVRLVNATQRAVAFTVGVYRYAERTDAGFVNRSEEGVPDKPPVILSLGPAQPAGRALADEWAALQSGATAQNVVGEIDVEFLVSTAPSVQSGQTPVFSDQSIAPGAQLAVTSQRFFKGRVHVKKARNRALRSVTFTFLESA